MIFINNSVYGMTGGQMAPTTISDQKTTTSPFGRKTKDTGYPVKVSEILAALIPAHPGGLHAILRLLDRADLIIHRLYPARIGEGTAEAVIIETDNPALAETVLKESWIEIIS